MMTMADFRGDQLFSFQDVFISVFLHYLILLSTPCSLSLSLSLSLSFASFIFLMHSWLFISI
ncbi:hypothetical protein Scep_016925 [Stephania cephalantha]|uniref:Uncharacterized protein n=1 Tax=Stephania cephalantha TaxID=152367 RepID=A0AAP0IQI4_9MAGN